MTFMTPFDNFVMQKNNVISDPTAPHARSLSSCIIGGRTSGKVSGSRSESFSLFLLQGC